MDTNRSDSPKPIEAQTPAVGDAAASLDPSDVNAAKAIKVMVIDDSNTIRRTTASLLRPEGYEVLTAADGFEAMSVIADHRPDIIFVDIMMPRLDGYQTCTLIKNNWRFRKTPVIMLSSKDGLFDRARGRIAGSDAHINKPFTRQDLLRAIDQHVAVPATH